MTIKFSNMMCSSPVRRRKLPPLMKETNKKVRLERGAPDYSFISKLSGADLEKVRRATDPIVQNAEFMRKIGDVLLGGGRSNYIQICAPFELYALTRLRRPKHIVEVGVSAGVSSAFFLKALEENGKGVLHSIDLPVKETEDGATHRGWAIPSGKKSGWAIPRALKKNWDLRLGQSADILPELVEGLPSVDLFLYDVPYEIEEAKKDFATVDQKMEKESIALADNCQIPITWWARRRGKRIFTRRDSGLSGFSIS